MSNPLPDTRIEIVIEWFERCRDGARKMGKIDSAMLWDDGLKHIQHAAAELAAARDCRTCVNYRRFSASCWTLDRHHHAEPCTNADRYEALPAVRLWRTT